MISLLVDQGTRTINMPGYTDIIIRKKIGALNKDISKKAFYTENFIYEEAIKLETWELPDVKDR